MSRMTSVRLAAVTAAVGCVIALASPVAADETSSPSPVPEETGSTPAPPESTAETPEATPEPSAEPAPEERVQSAPSTEDAEPAPELASSSTSLTLKHGTILAKETSYSDVVVRSGGAPVVGARVTVTAKGPRTRTASGLTNSQGSVRIGLKSPGSGTFRVTATAAATATTAASTSSASTLVAQSDRRVSLMINSGVDRVVRKGENYWMRGKVLNGNGTPDVKQKVTIYRYGAKGKRSKVATRTTNSYGGFTYAVTSRSTGVYRAVASSSRYSQKVKASVTSGSRTLGQREKSLSFLLGARTGSKSIQSGGGATWLRFQKGTLVRNGSKTWVVLGRVQTEMNRRGGPAGSLRAPTSDVRCGLPESACLQTFSKGAVYANPKAKKTLTSAVAHTGGAAALVAVASSQVGYREPSYRKSKYNRWMGRTGIKDPWCGFLMSWTAYAAGRSGAIPKSKSFPALVKAEKARKRTTRTPRVGRLAYINYFRDGRTTHVGIVSKVSSSHVWVIEGNVSAGGKGRKPRGVHVVKRPRSAVNFYADPRY